MYSVVARSARLAQRGAALRSLLVLLAVAALTVAWGIFGRMQARAELQRQAVDAATPTVAITVAAAGDPADELSLPGAVEAYTSAPIYARISGYLKRWYVDIGAPVKSGQLLAEIEAPEVEQQLHQAQADVETAAANAQLAEATAKRYRELFAEHWVTQQDLDDRNGAAAAAKATLASAQAKVAQLRAQTSFMRVVAPFDGVVTARKTDIGALIDAGSATGAELFEVADTRKLRVYVDIPQAYAAAARPGLHADVVLAELPGQAVPATLVRNASALDPATRTLRTEFQIDNAKGELMPGGYAEVRMHLAARGDSLRLPANTLLFRSEGMTVAVVDNDGKAQLRKVELGRDFGAQVEVLSGVRPGDRVIINPPDSLLSGTPVRILETPPAAPTASAAAKAKS